ncbi:uncharacterized protein IAS62_001692 [Cryptococcus decagattii]|uniref:Uncharacterized protein n=1 Tax=Cryptococcus decagattii TaxID=1859122 RepID=A0ABZ2APT8_9TREE
MLKGIISHLKSSPPLSYPWTWKISGQINKRYSPPDRPPTSYIPTRRAPYKIDATAHLRYLLKGRVGRCSCRGHNTPYTTRPFARHELSTAIPQHGLQ